MALQLLQLPLVASSASSSTSSASSSSSLLLPPSTTASLHSFLFNNQQPPTPTPFTMRRKSRNGSAGLVFVNKEETEASVTSTTSTSTQVEDDPDAEDLEYISQIKRVLELLKKNRDMTFNEVKLTVMIEDPRDVERRRLLGIDDENAPTRDDLAAVLEEVNEGKIPEDRISLQMLAEEMIAWPNLEVEISKQKKPGRSLYAKATDTGIDPKEAAKRLNVDWDSAAQIEDVDDTDDVDVPAAVGYGALYLVSAFPIIIGVSVVLILFYNSLQ